MKLIIDTDPGIDDAMAIAYAAAAPEIELLGLTTVFGNTFVYQSSRNARYLLNELGVELPVAEGAALPYGATSYEPSVKVHGREGYGDLERIDEIGQNHTLPAAEYLVEMARKHKGELVVCAIGPLTNIADALRLDPEFGQNLRQLVIMGGAVYVPGNISDHAEANIFHDAQAADEVFTAPMNTVLVGLDVTLDTLYTPQDFDHLAETSPRIGGFLHKIAQFYLKFYKEEAGLDGCGLHDSTAVIACTHPHLFDMVETGIRVAQELPELGNTQPDPERPAIKVCRGIDGDAVVRLFSERLYQLP